MCRSIISTTCPETANWKAQPERGRQLPARDYRIDCFFQSLLLQPTQRKTREGNPLIRRLLTALEQTTDAAVRRHCQRRIGGRPGVQQFRQRPGRPVVVTETHRQFLRWYSPDWRTIGDFCPPSSGRCNGADSPDTPAQSRRRPASPPTILGRRPCWWRSPGDSSGAGCAMLSSSEPSARSTT